MAALSNWTDQETPVTKRAADGARRFVQIPTDHDRSATTSFEVAFSTFTESVLPAAPLDATKQAEFLGVLDALLHCYTQQSNVAIDVFLRNGSGAERRVAHDATLAGDLPLSAAIALAADALASAVSLGSPSNVAVTFFEAPPAWEGSFDAVAFAGSTPAPYELHFILPATHPPSLVVAYSTKLFEPSTIDRLMASLVGLLDATSLHRDTAIERLPMLGQDEIRALTVERDSGTASYPKEPIHRAFEALAVKQPAAVAAMFQGRTLTYGQLEARSNRLAQHLVAAGVGPEVPVAVCIRPSLDVLVAILAIFKARGIYLPLDPAHPEAMLTRMLDEAQPRLVVTHSTLASLTRPDRFAQLCLDTEWGRVESQPATAPSIEPNLDDAAYLLYTSGTTGKPKGVVATQGNLAHYIHVAQQMYGFRSDDVFTSLARYTFSISLFDLLSPLACGGSLRFVEREDVLAPERLSRVLAEVTVVHAGPSLLASLFRYLRATPSAPQSFPRMRHASTGGDLVPPSIMEEMKRVFENAEVYVIYGCTEISCMGTTFPVSRDAKTTRSFVGKPFPDVTLRVVDPKRELVPFGVVGEICFAGKGIVRGYLHQPELTAQKFVAIEGRRFYQTGDMGRMHADGNLEILGRRDFQVQLRGIRVELAGIENTVRELGLAAECAVVAKKLDVDDVRVVAFVVKPKDPNSASFRRALSAHLPDYMLPQYVVVLDAMPLTANGKLDRNRLQEMPFDTQRGEGPRATPQNDAERKIAEVFCRVLGISDIGVDDDFFDLGGHSLLAVIAMQEIDKALGFALSPHALFEGASVRSLAGHVQGAPPTESRPILLNAKCDAPSLFMLSGIHIYRELARRLDGQVCAYGVFAGSECGQLDTVSTTYSVEEMAREYIRLIRRQQPAGPYFLLGYSFAGIVAYEVAQQLIAGGDEVRFLALVDAVLPEWTLGWRFRLSQLKRLPSVRANDLWAFVRRRLRRKLTSPGSEFARYENDPKVGPLEQQRDQVNYRAADAYMPQIRPFAGKITLIASGTRLRDDPLKSSSGGWEPYVPSLDVETLDGDHFQLLGEDPYVSHLAEILAARLKGLASPRS